MFFYVSCSHGFSDQTIASDCRVPSSSSVNKLRPHRRSRSLVGIFLLLTTRLGYKYIFLQWIIERSQWCGWNKRCSTHYRPSQKWSEVRRPCSSACLLNSPELIDSIDHRWRHILIKKVLSPSPSRRIGTVAKPTSSLSSTSKPKEVCNLVLFHTTLFLPNHSACSECDKMTLCGPDNDLQKCTDKN